MTKYQRFYCILFIICGIMSLEGRGQQSSAPSHEWRAFLSGTLTLDSMTRYMNRHTDIRFAFNSGVIADTKKIKLPPGYYDLRLLLQQIQASTSLVYSRYGQYVIFRLPPVSAPHHLNVTREPLHHLKHIREHLQPLPISGMDSSNDRTRVGSFPRKPVAITLPGIQPVNSQPGRPIHSSSRNSSVFAHDTTRSSSAAFLQRARLRPIPTPTPISTPKPTPEKSVSKNHPFPDGHLTGGVFATETFYANLGVEAGIRPLYIILGIGTNFHLNAPHIGFGSLILHRPDMDWGLRAEYTPLKTNVEVDSGLNKIGFTIKGKLYSGSIEWSKHLADRWLLKVAAGVNILQTTYYKNGVATAPKKYFTQNANGDKTLWLLHTPLLISNTYNASTFQNQKIWPALSIGLYYDLNFFRRTKGTE